MISGGLVGGQVVEDDVDVKLFRHVEVDELEEPQHVFGRVAFACVVRTSPVATFMAANRSIVPWRL